MEIPVEVRSCGITEGGNAEGILSFNAREFEYVIVRTAKEGGANHEISIKGIDIENLNRAGFELDLDIVFKTFSEALAAAARKDQDEKKSNRERAFMLSRLHELKPVLGENFSMMPQNEFINSKSGALYSVYKETYLDHTKELTIFMDHDKFVVYDNLNRVQVGELSMTPQHAKEIIDSEIAKWRHKIDFKLLLKKHAEEEGIEVNIEPLRASEYFKHIQEKENAHAKDVLENHLKYLKELGKLGEEAEITDIEHLHENNTETDTLHKRKILGTLSEEHLRKVMNPIPPEDL